MTATPEDIQLPPSPAPPLPEESPDLVETPNSKAPKAESPTVAEEQATLPMETPASVIQETTFSEDIDVLLADGTKAPKGRWFTLMTLVLAIGFMGMTNFISIPLPNIVKMLAPDSFIGMGDMFMYGLQWWGYALVFCTLGPRLASIAYIGLLVLSLFIPVFSAGGGLPFLVSPSHGFVVAALFIFPVFVQKWQRFLHFQFGNTRMKHRKKGALGRFFHASILSFWCMVALHFFGLMGVGILTFFGQLSGFEVKQWVLLHTVFALPYDVLGVALIAMGTRVWRMIAKPLLY